MNHLLKIVPLCGLAFTGCAVIRSVQPVETPDLPDPVAIESVRDTVNSLGSSPLRRVQLVLHSAFSSVEEGRTSAALDSLAIATDHLIASFTHVKSSKALPLDRPAADDLTQATIDIYFDALPGHEAIQSSNPLGRLIQSLPSDLRSILETNNRYRSLYVRTLAGTSPVQIDVNAAVLEKIAFFQSNNQRIFKSWMNRMGAYGPLIRRTLREEGIPEDLIFLAMIESGFNTKAYSRAKAVGMWQFIKHTGRLYGLKTDTWIDERRDPEKSTRAAARHLRHLYNLFGDWQLVITGYNCGQGRLQRSIRKDGSHDFWKLKSLPKETRNHLPKYMAVLLMSRDPEFFGVNNLLQRDPFAYDIIQVTDAVDLRLGAQCAGTTYETMRELNPELRLGYSPPVSARKTYSLRVPIGTSERFLDRYARIPADKKVQLVDYRVRPGDTVSGIAKTFDVRTSVVLDANGIRNPRRLKSGQKLKIPIQPKQSGRAFAAIEKRNTKVQNGKGERVVYRVKRGDTLWDIARSQGVTTDKLRAWNTLKTTRHIHPGDRLTIWRIAGGSLPEGATAVANLETVHRVKRGDTLWDIARAYKTNVRELKRLNGILDVSQINAGDKIRIRSSSDAVE